MLTLSSSDRFLAENAPSRGFNQLRVRCGDSEVVFAHVLLVSFGSNVADVGILCWLVS